MIPVVTAHCDVLLYVTGGACAVQSPFESHVGSGITTDEGVKFEVSGPEHGFTVTVAPPCLPDVVSVAVTVVVPGLTGWTTATRPVEEE